MKEFLLKVQGFFARINAEKVSSWPNLCVFQICNLFSVLFTISFVSMGVVEIWHGFSYFWGLGDATSDPHKALSTSINGLEFFFLAPLSFFVLRALAHYVEDVAIENEITKRTRQDMIEVKSLITSLLIAVVATYLVGQVIASSPDNKDVNVGGVILMGMLMIQFFGLEIIILKESKSSDRSVVNENDPVHKDRPNVDSD